jgi:hypothetical protein
MISITTTTFNIDGALLFSKSAAKVDGDTLNRRLTVDKTLDGGVFFHHGGVSQGDRVFMVQVWNPTKSVVEQIKSLMLDYEEFYIAVPEGVFKGTIADNTPNSNGTLLRLRLEEKLS